jgi:hypothetical protein
MTNLFTPYNKRESYLVVDESGNVVSKFRAKITALEFVRENWHFYGKLEVVKNEKI